jgi:hypothetical protein
MGVRIVKYYLKDSSIVEYIEIPDAVKNMSTLIIQPKDHKGYVQLESVIRSAKNDEIPEIKMTVSEDNCQIHLKIPESSNYLTLFRWMVDYQLITREFSGQLYKAAVSEKLAILQNGSKAFFHEKASEVPQNTKNPAIGEISNSMVSKNH